MKRLFSAAFVSLFLISSLHARDVDSVHFSRVIIGKLECGRNINFKESKLEAGLALAFRLTPSYRLIPSSSSDSVARQLRLRLNSKDTLNPAVNKVAQAMLSSTIVFARIDRLQNILRAEVQVLSGDAFKTKTTGRGYALIRFRSEKKNDVVEDPAVLCALQRALCVALDDSTLYKNQQGSFRVFPAATVVCGGMSFVDDPSLPHWDLFGNHTVNGFDVVVNVFDAMKSSDHFVCYDVDTRDSIFALFKLYLIENDNEPSREELDALYRLEVQYYIRGVCTRTEQGADIKLFFCSINSNGTYNILRTAHEFLANDDLDDFRRKVKMLTLSVTGTK